MSIEYKAGNSAVKLCIGLGPVNLLKNHLAVGTSQFKCTVGKTLVLVFFHKTDS